jgi:ribosome-associated translation inhibitor RaiA
METPDDPRWYRAFARVALADWRRRLPTRAATTAAASDGQLAKNSSSATPMVIRSANATAQHAQGNSHSRARWRTDCAARRVQCAVQLAASKTAARRPGHPPKELMQVLLHTDHHTPGGLPMAEHLRSVVDDALERFGERVTRVEAHLSDANGEARADAGDIHCTLIARLIGTEEVVVKDQARSAHQAIEGAVRKLRRAVGAAVAKQDPRRPSHVKATADDQAAEGPGTGTAANR